MSGCKMAALGCGCLILIVMVVMGVGIWYISQSVTQDPAEVAELAQQILPFEKPEGLQAIMGADIPFFKVKMAIFATSEDINRGLVIMVLGLPGEVSREEIAKEMKDSQSKQGDDRKVVEKREDEVFTVRGEEVPGSVQVVENDEKERFNQYMLVLDHAGKTVMLMITGPVGELNHDWVQKLLDTVPTESKPAEE